MADSLSILDIRLVLQVNIDLPLAQRYGEMNHVANRKWVLRAERERRRAKRQYVEEAVSNRKLRAQKLRPLRTGPGQRRRNEEDCVEGCLRSLILYEQLRGSSW